LSCTTPIPILLICHSLRATPTPIFLFRNLFILTLSLNLS
jgi:hypothetical protein